MDSVGLDHLLHSESALFLCLYNISLGWYYWKRLVKNEGGGGGGKKDQNREEWPYWGPVGVSIEGDIQTFCILWSTVLLFHFVHLFLDELNWFCPWHLAPNCFPSRITSSKLASTSPTYLRGILVPAFRSLICLCQTSWAQICN